jgi:hypothetical protein
MAICLRPSVFGKNPERLYLQIRIITKEIRRHVSSVYRAYLFGKSVSRPCSPLIPRRQKTLAQASLALVNYR